METYFKVSRILATAAIIYLIVVYMLPKGSVIPMYMHWILLVIILNTSAALLIGVFYFREEY